MTSCRKSTVTIGTIVADARSKLETIDDESKVTEIVEEHWKSTAQLIDRATASQQCRMGGVSGMGGASP